MEYDRELFGDVYDDDMIETKLTEKDEKNLKKMRKMINSLICSEEFKNGLYCTINDYYEEAMERGFKMIILYENNNGIYLTFKTTEHNQTSLLCDKDNCEETEYGIDLSIYYYEEDVYRIYYNETNAKSMVILKSHNIIINKSNNSIKSIDTFKIDKKELNDIIKRIKFNFNIK